MSITVQVTDQTIGVVASTTKIPVTIADVGPPGPTGPAGTSDVTVYADFASFPTASSAGDGAWAKAADTGLIYNSNGTDWVVNNDGRYPVANIVAYGAIGDDNDASAAANDAAITAAVASGSPVYVPVGIYRVSAAIDATGINALFGEGKNTSIIKAHSSTALPYLVKLATSGLVCRDVGVHGNSQADVGWLIHSCSRAEFMHVGAQGTLLYGFKLDNDVSPGSGNNNAAGFTDCLAVNNSGIGFGVPDKQTNNNAITINNLVCFNNGGDGLVIKGFGWTVSGGITASNGGYGIRVGEAGDSARCQSIWLFNPWIENNTTGGVIFAFSSRSALWANSTGGIQGVDWANSEANHNVAINLQTGSAHGEINIESGSSGQRLAFQPRQITMQAGSDTDPVLSINGAGNFGIRLGPSSVDPGFYSCTGSPEGQVKAGPGSLCIQRDGDPHTQLWIKVSGTLITNWRRLGEGYASYGDTAATLGQATAPTNVWTAELTADRAVTLGTGKIFAGHRFRVVRSVAATGAFNLNVGTGPLKALAAGEWCDVLYDGSAWILTAFGSL